MYQIRDDKRTRRSAALLKEGLMKCLNRKNFNDIGISDICLAGGVSRTTFYRLFDTPADVLAYACDSLAEESVKLNEQNDRQDHRHRMTRFISLLMENCELLAAIVKCDRRDIIESSFQRYYGQNPENREDGSSAYFAAINGAIITTILFKWEKGGKKESPEQLYDIFCEYIRAESAII